jgi:hypothetical protein
MHGILIDINYKVLGQTCVASIAYFTLISHKAKGQSMSNIVHLFNNDTTLNDTKVSQFVKSSSLNNLRYY